MNYYRHRFHRDAGLNRIESALRETFAADKVSQHIILNDEGIGKVAEAGEVKSAFEVGSGTFSYSPKERYEEYEERIFSMRDYSLDDPETLPKYGLVGNEDNLVALLKSSLNNHGSSYLKLKPRVRARSTITMGDSLNKNFYFSETEDCALSAVLADIGAQPMSLT